MSARVYVAGPYTNEESCSKEDNVEAAIEAANALLVLGYSPYVPHLSHFWDRIYPHSYDCWMDLCLEFVKACDCVLRLPGDSLGADIEVELAEALEIPVFYSVQSLHEYHLENRNGR